jgi:uncharacterized protein
MVPLEVDPDLSLGLISATGLSIGPGLDLGSCLGIDPGLYLGLGLSLGLSPDISLGLSPDVSPVQWLAVSGFSFLAGFVDAIVGGGGLIQLPMLLLVFPQVPIAALFGTNKLASFAGNSMAVVAYSRRVPLVKSVVVPGAIVAGLFSFFGARSVSGLSPALIRPIVLGLLVSVALYTAFQPNLGSMQRDPWRGLPARWLAMGIGAVLGFYDGFFGPGTGSFLIFAFVSLLGLEFLAASASAKVLNWATNALALVAFLGAGQVLWAIALPMALCNLVGSAVGVRLAMLKGDRFIRGMFLVVVAGLIARLGWDMVRR